jgi:hypothetical protein
MQNMTTYEAWSLIIQAVTGVAIVATFAIYYHQLRAMRHASAAQNILAVVNVLQGQDVRDARRVVRKTLVGRPFASWTADEERAAALVCSTYDIAAILIRQGLVTPAPFVEDWGSSIKHCHEVLRDYIAEMRKPENSGPEYWNDFDWIYAEVLKRYGNRTA